MSDGGYTRPDDYSASAPPLKREFQGTVLDRPINAISSFTSRGISETSSAIRHVRNNTGNGADELGFWGGMISAVIGIGLANRFLPEGSGVFGGIARVLGVALAGVTFFSMGGEALRRGEFINGSLAGAKDLYVNKIGGAIAAIPGGIKSAADWVEGSLADVDEKKNVKILDYGQRKLEDGTMVPVAVVQVTEPGTSFQRQFFANEIDLENLHTRFIRFGKPEMAKDMIDAMGELQNAVAEKRPLHVLDSPYQISEKLESDKPKVAEPAVAGPAPAP